MTSRALPAAIALLTLSTALAGCTQDDAASQASTSTTPAGGASCSYASSGEKPARTVDPPNGQNVANQGTTTTTLTLDGKPVLLTLDRVRTPCTTNSFVSLAQQKYFDDTSCHRLVDAGIFVLQCGDPTGTGTGGPGYVFNDELDSAKAFKAADAGGVTYPKGTVAMANAGPGTNGSQFFLVWQDSPLPPNYTAFGTIDAAGLTAIQNIAEQGIAAGGQSPDDGKPNAPAKISQVTLG